MAQPRSLDEALAAVHSAALDCYGTAWDRIHIEWATIASADYAISTELEADDGGLETLTLAANVAEELRALRAAVAKAQNGLWPLSLLVTLQAGSKPGLNVNNDGELILDPQGADAERKLLAPEDIRPTVDEWRRELELHPRTEEQLPEWWKQRLVGIQRSGQPAFPSWLGREMPQTIADAEAITERVLPAQPWIERDPGFSHVLDAVEVPLMDAARSLTAPEQDAIFGRQGRRAQQDQRTALARTVIPVGLAALDALPADTVQDALDQWGRTMRKPNPVDSSDTRTELVLFVARNFLSCRFGSLPLNWPVK